MRAMVRWCSLHTDGWKLPSSPDQVGNHTSRLHDPALSQAELLKVLRASVPSIGRRSRPSRSERAHGKTRGLESYGRDNDAIHNARKIETQCKIHQREVERALKKSFAGQWRCERLEQRRNAQDKTEKSVGEIC